LAAGLSGFLLSIYPDMHLFTHHIGPLYWIFFGLLFSLVAKESAASIEVTGHGGSMAQKPGTNGTSPANASANKPRLGASH
jgi:hypothetical protein